MNLAKQSFFALFLLIFFSSCSVSTNEKNKSESKPSFQAQTSQTSYSNDIKYSFLIVLLSAISIVIILRRSKNNKVLIEKELDETQSELLNLKNIPEFAGGHHEKMDGTGYPKGLKADQMSPQAKIMAIADIYEALTAADRPYKEGKKLSQAMRIMGFMKNDYHIDEDLFEIFVNSGVYKKYAEDHVASNQIDQIDEKAVLGIK